MFSVTKMMVLALAGNVTALSLGQDMGPGQKTGKYVDEKAAKVGGALKFAGKWTGAAALAGGRKVAQVAADAGTTAKATVAAGQKQMALAKAGAQARVQQAMDDAAKRAEEKKAATALKAKAKSGVLDLEAQVHALAEAVEVVAKKTNTTLDEELGSRISKIVSNGSSQFSV